jgi:uncharacterized protein (DUF305 family)
MIINMSRFLFYRRLLPIILVLFSISAKAQMHMHMDHDPAQKKHPYLLMMDTMMTRMDTVNKAAPEDVIFMKQMLPHHLGAIAMANYEIRYGRNQEMIQLAKSILAEQKSEVESMTLWLQKNEGKRYVENPSYLMKLNKSMTLMMEHMPESKGIQDVDNGFAAVMLPHHQAAIDMAKALLSCSARPDALAFCRQLISNEEIEVEQMLAFLNDHEK